jgi:hypothetical protein
VERQRSAKPYRRFDSVPRLQTHAVRIDLAVILVSDALQNFSTGSILAGPFTTGPDTILEQRCVVQPRSFRYGVKTKEQTREKGLDAHAAFV